LGSQLVHVVAVELQPEQGNEQGAQVDEESAYEPTGQVE